MHPVSDGILRNIPLGSLREIRTIYGEEILAEFDGVMLDEEFRDVEYRLIKTTASGFTPGNIYVLPIADILSIREHGA